MADENRGIRNRPLSPHLTIYRPQINSVMSIFHRITGVGLALGSVMVVVWFLAAATDAAAFDAVDGLITSWIGGLIMLGSALALWYHFFSGLRHLVWDTGHWFDLATIDWTSYLVIGAAAAMSLVTVIVALW